MAPGVGPVLDAKVPIQAWVVRIGDINGCVDVRVGDPEVIIEHNHVYNLETGGNC